MKNPPYDENVGRVYTLKDGKPNPGLDMFYRFLAADEEFNRRNPWRQREYRTAVEEDIARRSQAEDRMKAQMLLRQQLGHRLLANPILVRQSHLKYGK